MCPYLFVTADFGLLKFWYFVDLSIEEDLFSGGKVCRKDDFVSRGWAFTFQQKIRLVKTTRLLVCGRNIIHY